MINTHPFDRRGSRRYRFPLWIALALASLAPTMLSTSWGQEPRILWTQYGVANGSLKLAVHTDAQSAQPSQPVGQLAQALVELYVRPVTRNPSTSAAWTRLGVAKVEPLTAMAVFRVPWDATRAAEYRVQSGTSRWRGIIRAEPPAERGTLRLMTVACVKDQFYPQANAVRQMIHQDPDLLFFAGDQLYETNADGKVVFATSSEEIPAAMDNYLAKWRRFGMMFRDLLKDRPSIMITDDHDVYADDLWGRGGRRMAGPRTNGGYQQHPSWVNAAERVQTWHLPDPASPRLVGAGIRTYYTSLDYGGVRFAILEDRKFKSAPGEVLDAPIDDPRLDEPNTTLEVIKDPAFDIRKLDGPGLQLLGPEQEAFLARWARRTAKQRCLAAVLSQSPYANVGNYQRDYGDMDSNGWPQSARNRALRAIQPSQAVMISGDIHYGTIHRHGLDRWGDGPWAYSLPAFTSPQNRTWNPVAPPQGGANPAVSGSGNHFDRFGNRVTMAAKADGLQGYGIVKFDKDQSAITFELYTLDAEREPRQVAVAGWPHRIKVQWPQPIPEPTGQKP